MTWFNTLNIAGIWSGGEPKVVSISDPMPSADDREYTPISADISASGDTEVHEAAEGKVIRLRWTYALNDPASPTPAKIKIKLGSTVIFNTFGVSKSQVFTGNVGEKLFVNLNRAGDVACSFLIEEITP